MSGHPNGQTPRHQDRTTTANTRYTWLMLAIARKNARKNARRNEHCEQIRSILTYGCKGIDLSTDNINRLNVCWNDVYRKIFGFHRWESVKFVQLHCERLDLVRIVQLHRLKFLNKLFNSRNQVICQCLSWCRRNNKYRKLCNEYDILDCSPLRFDVFAKFQYVCDGR